jgi:hypothetical protein
MDYIIILMIGALISSTLSSRKSISFFVCFFLGVFKRKYFWFIIDLCLTPTITVFLLYRGVVYN